MVLKLCVNDNDNHMPLRSVLERDCVRDFNDNNYHLSLWSVLEWKCLCKLNNNYNRPGGRLHSSRWNLEFCHELLSDAYIRIYK